MGARDEKLDIWKLLDSGAQQRRYRAEQSLSIDAGEHRWCRAVPCWFVRLLWQLMIWFNGWFEWCCTEYIVVDTVDVSGEIGMAGLYQNDGHPGQVILFSIINVVMRGKVLIEKFSQRNSPSMPIQRLVPGTWRVTQGTYNYRSGVEEQLEGFHRCSRIREFFTASDRAEPCGFICLAPVVWHL